jgi:hypothetical protein
MSQAEEKTVSKDGYEVTFYPGFAGRCSVKNGEGEVELYRQTETYRLPNGERQPKRNFRLSLKGGKRKQDVTLRVEDPERRIKSITVELYSATPGEDGVRTEGIGGDGTESFTVDNDARTCPPEC